jgi:NADH-quinone oxidoreductase subunit N
LAYSSISHAGYALLGVVAGTPAGVAATQSYLLAYAFMTLGAFAVVAGLGPKGESLSGYEGLAAERPGLAALLLVLLLSLTGIPPTAGFAAKFLVFGAALDAGYAALAVLGVACSVVSAFFYLRIAVLMYMSPAKGEAPARLPLPAAAAVAFAAAATLLGGVLPEGLTAQPAEPVEIHRMAP